MNASGNSSAWNWTLTYSRYQSGYGILSHESTMTYHSGTGLHMGENLRYLNVTYLAHKKSHTQNDGITLTDDELLLGSRHDRNAKGGIARLLHAVEGTCPIDFAHAWVAGLTAPVLTHMAPNLAQLCISMGPVHPLQVNKRACKLQLSCGNIAASLKPGC